MRVSKARGLEGALIATGFPYRANTRYLDAYLAMLKAVTLQVAGVRPPRAAALEPGYVAARRGHSFWGVGVFPPDTACGKPLLPGARRRLRTRPRVPGRPRRR